MSRFSLAVALPSIAGVVVAASAAANSGAEGANTSKVVQCVASERDGGVERAYVEEQAQNVELLKKGREAAKAKFDAATAVRDVAVQKLAQEKISAGDAGDDGGGAAEVAKAASDLADALIAWNRADAAASCAEKEYDEAKRAYERGRLYQWAIEPTVSVAGGASDVSLVGGGLHFSTRDFLFFSEVQLGVDLGMLRLPQPPFGVRVPTTQPDPRLAIHAPLRIFFGDAPVGLFLGVGPGLFMRNGNLVGAAVPEGGMRLRAIVSCKKSRAPVGLVDVKLFAQPWIFFDGLTTAVLFGVELGVGLGPKSKDDDSITWKDSDAPSE
jgi:hypothetical protein